MELHHVERPNTPFGMVPTTFAATSFAATSPATPARISDPARGRACPVLRCR